MTFAWSLIKEYAGKDAPQFIEGQVFKIIVPVPQANDTINDTISEPVKQRLIEVIRKLYKKPGLKISDLMKEFNVSEATMKRDLQKIRLLVEYKGSKKTGGFFLTEYILARLAENQG